MHNPSMDPSRRYHPVSRALHWLVAALVFGQIALGCWMQSIPKSPPGHRAGWFNLHKSIGLTVAALMIARLAWRRRRPPAPLPAGMPAWQRNAAGVNHALLYALLILQPTFGYLGSTFTRYPIKYFGVALPHWGWDSPALKDLFSALHLGTAWLLAALIALHVAAALKHKLVDRDGVFERMWPASASAPPGHPDSPGISGR
jgi:cytochrome b561